MAIQINTTGGPIIGEVPSMAMATEYLNENNQMYACKLTGENKLVTRNGNVIPMEQYYGATRHVPNPGG